MAEVNLAIHGKYYGIACDEGQEGRVSEVGSYVDARARDIAAAGAASNETHLLVLTALVLADEVKELQDLMESATANSNDAGATASVQNGMSKEDEGKICEALTNLTSRLDSVADRLSNL